MSVAVVRQRLAMAGYREISVVSIERGLVTTNARKNTRNAGNPNWNHVNRKTKRHSSLTVRAHHNVGHVNQRRMVFSCCPETRRESRYGFIFKTNPNARVQIGRLTVTGELQLGVGPPV